MKCALVGPPGSGKSSVFDLLTGGAVPPNPAQNRIGIIKVPDLRLDQLVALYQPKKITPAEISFVDFCQKGAKKIFGLSPDDLNALKTCAVLSLVVASFQDGLEKAAGQLKSLLEEMTIEDLAIVERRLERLEKEGRKDEEYKVLGHCREMLEQNRHLRLDPQLAQVEMLRNYCFLTLKPALLLLNQGEGDFGQAPLAPLQALAEAAGMPLVPLCAGLEKEIAALSPADQGQFLREAGLHEPMRDRFIRAVYALMDYLTFYTVGEDDCRAWKVRRGANAKEAAGTIHSDLARGFIRAEVTPYAVLMQYKDEAKVKAAGKLQLEGKEYLVQDGDILHVRFNV